MGEATRAEGETAAPAAKLPWFALAAAGLAADLWTKHLVFYPHVLDPDFAEGRFVGQVLSLPWWRTVLAYNPGVTFGLGAGFGTWALSLFTAVVIALLVRALLRTSPADRLRLFAFSIIIGGAVGNLYDRALRPYVEADRHPGVRDFIDWYVPEGSAVAEFLKSHHVNNHWYTFNVADALIVSGVVLLAWKILREKPADDGKSPAEAAL